MMRHFGSNQRRTNISGSFGAKREQIVCDKKENIEITNCTIENLFLSASQKCASGDACFDFPWLKNKLAKTIVVAGNRET